MKIFKVMILCGILVALHISSYAFADSANYNTPGKRQRGTTRISSKYKKDLEKIFDLKMYHDPYYVHSIMSGMDEVNQKKSQLNQGASLSVVLDQKDVETWNNISMAMPLNLNRKATSKEILTDPHGSYVQMIMQQEIPSLTGEKVKEVGKIDEQAIKNLMIMATESGTDVGANPVTINYQVE